MLREGDWEARAVCSRPWLKWLFLAAPGAALFAAAILFFSGSISIVWLLLVGGACLVSQRPSFRSTLPYAGAFSAL